MGQTTYLPLLTFVDIWTTTYLPRLVNVVCERPLTYITVQCTIFAPIGFRLVFARVLSYFFLLFFFHFSPWIHTEMI